MAANSPKELRYNLTRLDNVEDLEKYKSYGGFSTVWLARDDDQNRLVSLKMLTAEASRHPKEIKLLRHLDEHAQANPWRGSIVTMLDDFTVDGPNGRHLCCVSQVGGPSFSAIADSLGETAGTRHLRAPLARKLARQLAKVVSFMHDVGIVHGDITPKNVLLQLKGVDSWSTETIYQQLGRPVKDDLFTISGKKPDLYAPQYIVEPASFSCVDAKYISEQILLIDLGEAFPDSSPPTHGVGTPVSYCSPELILERKASRASDIWALACTIFQMRSGFPLFESFIGSSHEVLEETVRILGMPPESSHSLWKKKGVIIPDHVQLDGAPLFDRIMEIGMYDEESAAYNSDIASLNKHAILEPSGKRFSTDEAIDLTGLLQRMLDYTPENRMSAENVTNHSWFADKEHS